MTPSKLLHNMIIRCERTNACKNPVTMVHRVHHAYTQTCIIILPLYSLQLLMIFSQGCDERHDKFLPKPDWVDKNIIDYGYTKLQVLNHTHLYLEQISDDRVSKVRHRIEWLTDPVTRNLKPDQFYSRITRELAVLHIALPDTTFRIYLSRILQVSCLL